MAVKKQAVTKVATTESQTPEGTEKTVSWGPFTAIIGAFAALFISQAAAFYYAKVKYGGIGNVTDGGVEPWTYLGFEAGIALLMVATIFFIVRMLGGNIKQLGFYKTPVLQMIYSTITVLAIYIFTAIIVFQLLEFIIPDSTLTADQDLGYTDSIVDKANLIPIFIGLVFVASVSEELLFRGFIFKGLRTMISFWPAAVFSSLIFALVHGQFNVGVDVFLMALGAAWLLERTGSIYASILMHMFKNTIAFILVYQVNIG